MTRTTWRRFAALAVPLAWTAAIPGVAGQDSAPSGTQRWWESRNFGILVFYDPFEWTLDTETSAADWDDVHFVDSTANTISFGGTDAWGSDVVACRDALVDAVVEDAMRASVVQEYVIDLGHRVIDMPESFENRYRAWTLLDVRYDYGEGSGDDRKVVAVDCLAISDVAVAWRLAVTNADAWTWPTGDATASEAWSRDEEYSRIAGLHHALVPPPWDSYEVNVPDVWEESRAYGPIGDRFLRTKEAYLFRPDASGAPRVQARMSVGQASHPSAMVVENRGPDPLMVDQDFVVLRRTDMAEHVQSLGDVTWDDGVIWPAGEQGSRILAPGERRLATVAGWLSSGSECWELRLDGSRLEWVDQAGCAGGAGRPRMRVGS